MAKSKHNKTGNGTHRERIFKYHQQQTLMRKAMLQLEKEKLTQMVETAKPTFEVTTEGAVSTIERLATEVIQELADKEDGFGHGLEDSNLQDTLREFKGMVQGDKHEQLMDTFVEEEKTDA